MRATNERWDNILDDGESKSEGNDDEDSELDEKK